MCARYLVDKNVEVVGMFTRKSHVGKEVGELVGMPGEIPVKVSNNPETQLASLNADIAVIGTGSTLASRLNYAVNTRLT